MKNANAKRISDQINSLKQRFSQHPGLPFNDILSTPLLSGIVNQLKNYRDRIFSPLVTLSAFIYQVLSSDHSCRAAVARVLADRMAQGESSCSSATAAYSKARQRLPTEGIMNLVQQSGEALDQQSEESWKWKGRSVKLVDGTTVSMPDTPENQAGYPQQKEVEAGVGFPIARLVAIISLACGAVINLAIGHYEGKQTGEHALLRSILQSLSSGDIMLADKYYCSYFLIAMLLRMGVDVLCPLHSRRKADFRQGKLLGNKDHIVVWNKPIARPEWMDEKTYQDMPETLTIRELKVDGKILVTTLLDKNFASKKELGQLYQSRWNVEIDLKTIKETMQMDILRCKTPEMVRKEIAVHLLAYNLIRTVMAQAAQKAETLPRQISPKGTIQLLNAFRDILILTPEPRLPMVYETLLDAIAQHPVGQRPGRLEPRVKKRRHKNYPYLNEPRNKLREKLLQNTAFA
jgi:hypothetical protein